MFLLIFKQHQVEKMLQIIPKNSQMLVHKLLNNNI